MAIEWNTIMTPPPTGASLTRRRGDLFSLGREKFITNTDFDIVPVTGVETLDVSLHTNRREIDIYNTVKIGNLYLSGCGFISSDPGRAHVIRPWCVYCAQRCKKV